MKCTTCGVIRGEDEWREFLNKVCNCLGTNSVCSYCQGFICPCCLYEYDDIVDFDTDTNAYDRAMKGI